MRALATAAVACMHGRYVWRFNGNTQCRRARPRVNSKRISFAASSDELLDAAVTQITDALIDGTGVFRYTAVSYNGNYLYSCFGVVPTPSEVHSLLFSGPGMSFLGQPYKCIFSFTACQNN